MQRPPTAPRPPEALPAPEPLPPAVDFYLMVPLYEFHKISTGNVADIQQLQYFSGTLDAYCLGCGNISIFQRDASYTHHLTPQEAVESRQFSISFLCQRQRSHRLFFLFAVTNKQVGKIGQLPSLADLHSTGILQYRKLLGDERYRELSRAIGLAAHGIGIGSYVYLRRVFESLILEARDLAAQAPDFDEAAFQQGRMDDRILVLKDFLPSFLVENRALYGILSQGLHSLTEDECLRHFATVRAGIELILDEHIAKAARDAKLTAATREIGRLKGKLSS